MKSARSFIISTIVFLSMVLGVGIFTLIVLVEFPQALQLHFNPYALLSFLGATVNLTVMFIINRNRVKTSEAAWFSVMLASLAVWGIGEGLQRLGATPDASLFWAQVVNVGTILTPVGFLLFAVHYIDPDTPKRYSSLRIVSLFMASLFEFLNLKSKLILNYAPGSSRLTPWGYIWPYGPLFGFYLLWFELLFIGAVILLINYRRTLADEHRRKQVNLFIASVMVPLVAGTITDGLLPVLGIRPLQTAVLTTSIMSAMVAYGIHRYGLFRFTTAKVAEDILGTMYEAVVVTNGRLNIEYVNAAAERLTDRPADQLMGKPLGALFAPEVYKDLTGQIDTTLSKSGLLRIADTTVTNATGRAIPVSLSVSASGDLKTPNHEYVLVMNDITSLKENFNSLQEEKNSVEQRVQERTQQLRAEEARLEASINSLNIGFIMTDDQGEILLMNGLAKELLIATSNIGYDTPSTWTIRNAENAMQGYLDLSAKLTECLTNHKAADYRNLAAGSRILDIYMAPITDGVKVIGCVMLLDDVTEAKVLARSKDEFFSIASHELRTPLTAIRGNAAMLTEYMPDTVKDPQVKQVVQDIHDSSVRLIQIVNDFLDVSRIDQGSLEMKLEAVDMAQLASEALKEVQTLASAKQITLELIPPTTPLPRVSADRNRLRQVMINLLGNAIKFTERGSVKLSLKHEHVYVRCDISDSGMGIAPENQKLLFRKFQQAASSIITRDVTQGTGLGLYISKQIIEKMSGNLYLEASTPGQGSTFTFALPVVAPASKELKPEPSSPII